MNKKILIIRHCKADGQAPEASLTETGRKQAKAVADFLKEYKIDRIISSPLKRAIATIEPYSKKFGLKIELDHRLSERILSSQNLPDWFEKLADTFDDLDLAYVGGESSRIAMSRAVSVVEDLLNTSSETSVIVTHGNLMALLLKHYDNTIGFNDWKHLSNPDIYLLHFSHDEVTMERLWN